MLDVDGAISNGRVVQLLVLSQGAFATICTNGWFSRRVVKRDFQQLQQSPRCERTQHQIKRSGVGSHFGFAAAKS